MASWAEFASAEPALASRVKERFAIRKHKTLATLRKDGSPRISGIEVEFADGELFLGMMPGSLKLRDLERDPRLALHSPTEDPPPATLADGLAKRSSPVMRTRPTSLTHRSRAACASGSTSARWCSRT